MHLLRLVKMGADTEGWAPISDAVMSVIGVLPKELVTIRPSKDGKGKVKLTPDGEAVIKWI